MGRAPLRLVWQARGPKAPGPPNAAAPRGRFRILRRNRKNPPPIRAADSKDSLAGQSRVGMISSQ